MSELVNTIANERPFILKVEPFLFGVVKWTIPLDFVAGWISEDA